MSCKEVSQLVRRAREQGWAIGHTGGGHICLRPPAGQAVYGPSTPHGGKRGLANLRAHLRRCGLDL